MESRHNNRTYNKGIIINLIILIAFALIILLPLIWLVLSGFKTNRELFLSPWKLPDKWLFSNYLSAWNGGIRRYFVNSVYITCLAILISTTLSSMAAFILSRITFKSQKLWLLFIVSGLMLAPQSSLVALFEMSKYLRIYNTRFGVALINAAFRIPFSTFLIRSWFLGISREIEESAIIDGCSIPSVFFRIILPLSRPIIGSAIIVSMRAVWNELMFALVLLESDEYKTIAVGLVNMKSFTRTNWPVLMCGLVIASAPLIIIFIILQKQFVRGLSAGAVKG